jgi:hypothetical protein
MMQSFAGLCIAVSTPCLVSCSNEAGSGPTTEADGAGPTDATAADSPAPDGSQGPVDGASPAGDAAPEAFPNEDSVVGNDGSSASAIDADTGSNGTLPIGFAALTAFDNLPTLKLGSHALSASSADPAMADTDYDNYLYTSGTEEVLFDAIGPGVIYRFWHTGDTSGSYRFYFDGQTTPGLVVDRGSFWEAQTPPFTAPLSLTDSQVSGGFVTYYPIAFARSLRITSIGAQSPDYYDINYARYSPDTVLVSFTGQEDATAARATLNAAGQNPIAPSSSDQTVQGTQTIASGSTTTLATLSGPAEITELRIDVPNISQASAPQSVTDDGRAFTGSSHFTVTVPSANSGVRLVRRMNYSVGDQTATVSIDGVLAGTWSSPGSDSTYNWRDQSFSIPAANTQGKISLDVTIKFVSSAIDWNEFHYWVYSTVSGVETQTDVLDVGNTASETAHGYTISSQTWYGTLTADYPPVEDAGSMLTAASLSAAHLQISWDGETTPSVDAPLGDFFGTGAGLDATVQALPVGNNNGTFYCYFPMPFAQSAAVAIANPAGQPSIPNVTYSVTHRPFTGDFSSVGYFHALYQSAQTVVGKDYDILDAVGSGHYVGVNLTVPNDGTTLEGNEHIFVDGARTPAISGTGTEDYFNGGFYFNNGPFTEPTCGAPAILSTSPFSAYRFNLGDLVPFLSSIRVAIQHGSTDDNIVPYASVAYYYLNGQALSSKTDSMDPGDATAVAAHSYQVSGRTSSGSRSGSFFSDDPASYTYSGNVLGAGGTSTWVATIAPANGGVTVRRLFDYSVPNQKADVYVDGTVVGTWYSPGGNTSFLWREEDFWLPASKTSGKSTITIKIVVTGTSWNEYGYQVFSTQTPQ